MITVFRLSSVARQLQSINISGNLKLTLPLLFLLLTCSTGESGKLEEIYFTDCGMAGPFSTEFLDQLTEKQTSAVPLRRLEFSCKKLDKLDVDSVSQIWQTRYGNTAVVKITDGRVTLSVER